MGSQQLLLIVLGCIVVGTGVALALLFFGSSAEQANKDALTQDCLKLISTAQAYFGKPAMLGGGDHSFKGITIRDCGMAMNEKGVGQNLTGTFAMVDITDPTLSVQAVSNTNAAQTVTVTIDMRESTPEKRLSVEYTGW
ncbi:MAG: hypothetical protein IH600_12185 [Bacteroidetes bacterium]|nr:hypothetical protein [Bacteroidota bacterium]